MSRFAFPAARFRSAGRTNSMNLAYVHTCHVRHARKKRQPRLRARSRRRERSQRGCFCVLSRWLPFSLFYFPFSHFSLPFLSRLWVSGLNVRRIKHLRLSVSLSLRRSPILSIFLYYRSRFVSVSRSYIAVFDLSRYMSHFSL